MNHKASPFLQSFLSFAALFIELDFSWWISANSSAKVPLWLQFHRLKPVLETILAHNKLQLSCRRSVLCRCVQQLSCVLACIKPLSNRSGSTKIFCFRAADRLSPGIFFIVPITLSLFTAKTIPCGRFPTNEDKPATHSLCKLYAGVNRC